MRLIQEGVVCPDCEGEEVHHDSWVFGDPDTPILRAYIGDPIKIRLVHGGAKETHSFHYHVHQWLSENTNQDSEICGCASNISSTPIYGYHHYMGQEACKGQWEMRLSTVTYTHTLVKGCGECNGILIRCRTAVCVIQMACKLKRFNLYQIGHYHRDQHLKNQGFQTLYLVYLDLKHHVHL